MAFKMAARIAMSEGMPVQAGAARADPQGDGGGTVGSTSRIQRLIQAAAQLPELRRPAGLDRLGRGLRPDA